MDGKQTKFSDPIRRADNASGGGCYAIRKAAGIDTGLFPRFMACTAGRPISMLDVLDFMARVPVRVLLLERRRPRKAR
jgi:hypothetical protein